MMVRCTVCGIHMEARFRTKEGMFECDSCLPIVHKDKDYRRRREWAKFQKEFWDNYWEEIEKMERERGKGHLGQGK